MNSKGSFRWAWLRLDQRDRELRRRRDTVSLCLRCFQVFASSRLGFSNFWLDRRTVCPRLPDDGVNYLWQPDQMKSSEYRQSQRMPTGQRSIERYSKLMPFGQVSLWVGLVGHVDKVPHEHGLSCRQEGELLCQSPVSNIDHGLYF